MSNPAWIMVSRDTPEGLLLQGPEPRRNYRRATWFECLRRRPCTPNTLAEAAATIPGFVARLRTVCATYIRALPALHPGEPADPWQALRDALAQWTAMADLCAAYACMTQGPVRYLEQVPRSAEAEKGAHSAEVEDIEAWLAALERAVQSRTTAAAKRARQRDPDDAGDGAAHTDKSRRVEPPDEQ